MVLTLAAGASTAAAAERHFTFASDAINAPPARFRSVLSGTGAPGDWRIILDARPTLFAPVSPQAPSRPMRRVLAQLSTDPAPGRYPLLIWEEPPFKDFTLTTSFKIVSGRTEQMAGVAFRIRDENTYYYIRASALGTNLSFFKMIGGQLRDRVSARAEIPPGQWHELKIECAGNQFRAALNGRELLWITDTAGKEALTEGRIGFWTKSDAVAYFADTRLTFSAREPFAQQLVRDALRQFPRLAGLRIYAPPAEGAAPRVIASGDTNELGQAGGKAEQAALAQSTVSFGKIKGNAHVTLPLHDRNGEPIAAVRVIMDSFPGQTEQNAVVRALPIVRKMEARVLTARDLAAR